MVIFSIQPVVDILTELVNSQQFDAEKIDEAIGALKRKCKQFKKEPEAKTNCVRIEYVDGYGVLEPMSC